MRVAIIGAGIMGAGIAQVLILHNYETTLIDVNTAILEQSKKSIHQRLLSLVDKEQIKPEKERKAFGLLKVETQLEEGCKRATIIIECVPEDLTLKKKIIARAQKVNKNAIIASNTSSISIAKLQEDAVDKSKIIGMHWFNPPPVIDLIEVIFSEDTNQEVIDNIIKFSIHNEKKPIKVKDFPGFATSRLGVVLGLEAIRMVEQGVASPQDIDSAMTLGYRHKMGPLELTDYVGLDTRLKIAKYLNSTNISNAFSIPPLLEKMVSEGKLGRKSGQGFYRWKDGSKI